MKPDEMIKAALAAILVLAFAGAALGFDAAPAINLVVTLLVWLLPGAIVGVLVGAIVAAITRELPPALLAGGATGVGLTIVLRLAFWIQMHAG